MHPYKEDAQSSIVVFALHAEIILEACESRISNVGPIKERKQVKKRKPRDEAKVNLPHQLTVLNETNRQD